MTLESPGSLRLMQDLLTNIEKGIELVERSIQNYAFIANDNQIVNDANAPLRQLYSIWMEKDQIVKNEQKKVALLQTYDELTTKYHP